MEENKGAAEVVERKEGYYWVNIFEDYFEVMKWNYKQKLWERIGIEDTYDDSDFKEIDERQICRS